jgi:transcriptional regulator GlxA family with amidase domain
MKNINVILFDNFTLLDALGPVEVFRCLENFFKINFYSKNGGKIRTNPELGIETKSYKEIIDYDVLLIPGGFGTRNLVDDFDFIKDLKELANKSDIVLTVCTGSALLAKTGLLSKHNATTNKMAFEWVAEQDSSINWMRKARWVVDGKFYTSSGITAGIDMALGFVSDTISENAAMQVSKVLEYIWNKNRDEDLFALS